jgi:hypothetical protein
MLARRIPLKPKPRYEVRFHPAFLDELADREDAEALLEEIAHDLSIPELRRGAITKVRESHGIALYRYKPRSDRATRILFSPHEQFRDVVMAIPRSSDYRASDLEAAIRRVAQRRRDP